MSSKGLRGWKRTRSSSSSSSSWFSSDCDAGLMMTTSSSQRGRRSRHLPRCKRRRQPHTTMTENNRNKKESKLGLLVNLPITSSNALSTYEALKADDVDKKTEHLLLNAKIMDPSIDVEQYLKDMRDARARNTILNGKAVPKKKSGQPKRRKKTEHSIDAANTYLQIAENAITDTNYEWAVTFLDKFDALYTSERSVKLRKELEKKSYYDGNLGNARRLLRLAELLFPTKRAKNVFDVNKSNLNDYYRMKDPSLPEEMTTETIIKNEVQRLINSGLNNMKKKEYDYAECAFQRAQYLDPNNKITDDLISDVQIKIKKSKPKPKKNVLADITLEKYRKLKRKTEESRYPSTANDYKVWANEAFMNEDIESVETLLRLAETFEFTQETRETFIMLAKEKNGLALGEASWDSETLFINTTVIESAENYIRPVEKAFAEGSLSDAWYLISKPEVESTPYVTELKQKIYMLSPWNNFWIRILGKKLYFSSSSSSSSS